MSTTVTETSRLAYEHVKPKLGEKYGRILDRLNWLRKDQTGQELARTIPGAWKRLSEMEALGLIRRKEKRLCSVTGEYAWSWEPIRGAEER
jgi:hypothetical protein